MAVRIAVVDPLPMFRQGVVAVLAASGHAVETPTDVVAWVRRRTPSLVLLSVVSERDWELLGRLCATARPRLVIALMVGHSGAAGARALRAGAQSVLPREVSGATLRQTVEATIGGQAVMPAAVAAVLTAAREDVEHGPSADQLSWLRQLASGVTVAQLAERVGYSERAMFRLLRDLYGQLGVRNRLQAIIRAQEAGWL